MNVVVSAIVDPWVTTLSFVVALAMRIQDMKRVLILTFKPAVQSAWEEDLNRHVDFEGWQFVCREGKQYEDCDSTRPIVCFGSF